LLNATDVDTFSKRLLLLRYNGTYSLEYNAMLLHLELLLGYNKHRDLVVCEQSDNCLRRCNMQPADYKPIDSSPRATWKNFGFSFDDYL
jgi:hypothetical protein